MPISSTHSHCSSEPAQALSPCSSSRKRQKRRPSSSSKLLPWPLLTPPWAMQKISFLRACLIYYTTFPVMLNQQYYSLYQQQYSIMDEESNQQGRFVTAGFEEGRGGRRAVDQTGLKAVAWYIKKLLDCCEKVSIKDLNNILFGILCQNLSNQQNGNHNEVFDITTQGLDYLNNKYGEESAEGLLPVQAVKNLRRRLYDVLNVLISADIVRKDQKSVGLAESVLDSNMRSILSSKDERKKLRDDLKQMVNKKSKAVARKRKEVKQIAKVSIQKTRLVEANRGELDQTAKEKLSLPLALIFLPPGSKLHLQESRILIESHNTFQITTETDMMDILHPISKGEISNILANTSD